MEYQPLPLPLSVPPDLGQYLQEELNRISQTLLVDLHQRLGFTPLKNPPENPQEGEVVFADGTNWDPGQGAGPYQRIAGAWTYLALGGGGTITVDDVDSESSGNGDIIRSQGDGTALWEQFPDLGEDNTSSNVGTGVGLAKAKSGVNLPFKSLLAGLGMEVDSLADEARLRAQDKRVDHGTVTSGTVDLDFSAGRVHEITVGGDISLSTSGWPASGKPADIEVILYDADLHTVTLPSWTWDGGSEPAPSGTERWILRTDDAGATVHAMQGFSENPRDVTVTWADITGNLVDAAEAIKDHGTVSSGTVSINLADSLTHKITAGGDFTVEVTGWPASGVRGEVEIIAVDWGGHTITLPTGLSWGDAGAPTFTTTGKDRMIWRTDDAGTNIDGMMAGQGF